MNQKRLLLKFSITRHHRACLVSSNRECFAHYRHISYFFNKSSLSLYVYTRGILGCLLRGQNPAGAIISAVRLTSTVRVFVCAVSRVKPFTGSMCSTVLDKYGGDTYGPPYKQETRTRESSASQITLNVESRIPVVN